MQQLCCSVRLCWVIVKHDCGPLFRKQRCKIREEDKTIWMFSLIEQHAAEEKIIFAQKINPFFMTFRSLSYYANIHRVFQQVLDEKL